MGTAKLMTPLFYDGNYNMEKKRMRAVLEREVSNGAVSYRLWRSDGKPDLEYPRAANDAYILHVEVNDHLVPLRMTDYALVNHCGLLPATVALYGSEEGRKEYFKHLRDSGAAGTGSFTEAMARETEKIIELGNDSARQADYIKSVLDQHVAVFLDAKESDGKSFPDFVGALILDEIPTCLALRTKYRAYKQEEALKRQAEQEEQDRAFCEERNRKAEQMIDLAIRTIRGGGTLKNEPISLYKSRYDSSTYSIVNHLMRRYQVDVPLRTQGWINDKLVSVTIENGKCEHLRYMRSKGAQCSQKIFDCMHELILRSAWKRRPERWNTIGTRIIGRCRATCLKDTSSPSGTIKRSGPSDFMLKTSILISRCSCLHGCWIKGIVFMCISRVGLLQR